ncbi:MAG: AAA family ATPase [Methanocellales archaeon]|nr:AAA family ATPase [Methanocellales archaeon]
MDDSHINIFIGKNGSGKSTILEAIYLTKTGTIDASNCLKKLYRL